MKKPENLLTIPGIKSFCLGIVVSAALFLPSQASADDISLNLKNVTVKRAIAALQQSHYSLTVDASQIDMERRITVAAEDEPIENVLAQIFAGQDVSYEINGRSIVVTRRAVPRVAEKAVSRTLSGVVRDDKGATIVGATVVVKGTTTGVTTDIDGNYSLTVPASTRQVTFSFLGYDMKKIAVKDSELFKLVTLVDASNELEDVVVVGFGVQKKESLVGAVQSVKPSDLQTSSSNLSTSFSGKIAGVIAVQKSGEPGADGASFWIRGISSFGSGQSPLLILDGVEITNQMLNNIPPETIESFSVLKDATATALYGSRGANGVMLITTKNGRDSEKMTVNVRAELGVSAPTRIPKIADGVTFMETYNEACATRGENPRYSREKIMGTKLGLDPYVYPNVDWYDMLFKNSTFNQNFNFNMTGGAKKIDYFLNASAFNENGIMRAPSTSKFDTNINSQKYLFQANVSADATKTTRVSLKMNTQLHYNHAPIESVGSLFTYALSALPCEFPATLPGEETDTFVRFGTANAWDGNTFINPYAQLCRGYSDKFRGHFTSALTVCQDLDFVTKGLSLTGMATFYNRVYSAVNRSFTPFMYQLSSYDVDADGNYSYTSSSTNTGTTYLGTSRGRDGYRELAFQVKLDYARTFNKKHDVGATFVYHQKERNMNISDAEEYASLPYRQQGLAGRVTYGFDKRYLIEANFGYNGSENFAPGKRFGFFPSIAGGWVISNEPFWKGIKDKVNLFKVRASYGLVGNDVISSNYKDRFPYLSTVAMDQWYDVMIGTNFDQKRGPILSIYGNENATWEESRKLDIGVEIGLFDSLNIIFDWFKEKRSGIFMQRSSLPSSFGMSGITPWGNIGKVDNRGVDISIDYNKAFSKDLILSLRGTFTYAHNEIVSMDEPQYKWGYQYKKGHPINSINCLIAEGLYRDEEDIASSPKSVYATRYPLQPGDIKYKDLNNDEVIDDNDKCWNGNPTVPEIIYGFGFSLKYKGFDCSAFFQGQGKVSIIMYDAHPFSTKAKPGFGLMQWIADEHWSESSPDPDAKYPRLSSQWNEHNGQANTLYVRNGKMLRLKTAEIGYSYKMMRVYVSGTNLLTFSPFKYWDPEKGSGNGLSYPLQRTFNLGFQFNF